MNKKEQLKLVNALSKSIASDLCAAIKGNRVPPEWDGHELRCWLADHHAASASISDIRHNKKSQRARDFENHCLVENL